ncbi:alkaline phosphatase D family protein [Roseibacillus ishigakijimensis]|uniref:Alkaline phosphatase D family protein n=1 Tax=Roseibacillus ishigakijimensis TaxID=454146 RepID=A0A934VJD7_9BACT|nr:alkaline phosphatase D family protein [Roseibacillus ishigakijimensis]MBK1832489.1 alkaline phosphatase D family protein [Roseibacillus ishigakijimensis]
MTDFATLDKLMRQDGAISRRLLLSYGASLAAIPLLGQRAWGQTEKPGGDTPFTLGVTSGDPDHRGVVLWTRLAPKPLEPGAGMPNRPVEVRYEVAEDENFRSLVTSGTTLATPQLGHSVHVELENLKPDRWYFYRFHTGQATSPVGRTRTLPRPNDTPDKLRFAFASCQNWEQGYFSAYEDMAEQEVDLVFHLGDYIYEYEAGRNGKVRTHLGKEIESLDDYRIRYAQYKSDPSLQKMHARCPWFVTWDDHEFDNNYATLISEEKGIPAAHFLARRANAYQAYYENMPLRKRSLPKGAHLQLFRKTSFGRLAQFNVLDTRQYRSDQPNNDRQSPLNAEAFGPRNTLLGKRQFDWLTHSLNQSTATWNVLAQQVMMGLVNRNSKGGEGYSMDQWPGYLAERERLLRFLAERRVPNAVVLTGDIHSNWANELRFDDRKAEQPVVASEFVCTSISSGGNGNEVPGDSEAMFRQNPCLKFYNRERGYTLCTLTPERWISDYRVVSDVLQPGGKTTSRARFALEAGSPLIQRV